jgi:hypothetical protein
MQRTLTKSDLRYAVILAAFQPEHVIIEGVPPGRIVGEDIYLNMGMAFSWMAPEECNFI